MSRSHLPNIFPWSKKRSQRRALSRMNQGHICKTAKREGKLKEYETLVAGDHSVVDQCVNVCYSDEENMDIPTHPKYNHEKLEAENKELKNDIEELKLKLKQLEDELETVKSENKSLRQENHRLKNPCFLRLNSKHRHIDRRQNDLRLLKFRIL